MRWERVLIPAVVFAVAAKPGAATAAPIKATKASQEARAAAWSKDEQLRYYREMTTGIGSNAIQAPFGRFLLVRSELQCLALRITEHVNVHDSRSRGESKYEWFLQADGSMDFSKANVQKGTGQVSESRARSGSFAPTIKVGTFPTLEWSLSDWIYFGIGATPVGGHPKGSAEYLREQNIRMASTEWVRIEDVKPKSEPVEWLSKAQATLFSKSS